VECIVVVEDHLNPQPVTIPQIKRLQLGYRHPLKRTLGVTRERRATPGINAKDEAEPVLFVLAESGPIQRAA
jgi:hypothetical protein